MRHVGGGVSCALVLAPLVAAACTGGGNDDESKPAPRPLPRPVRVARQPDGITLGDPTFDALPGARAEFGRLGGAVYEIEVPRRWNGRLFLFMHGYDELGPEAQVIPPDI